MPRISHALWVPTAAALAMTAGCSRTDNEPGPGGVTVSEAKALDDAAAMLESRDGERGAETKTGAETGTKASE